MEDKSVSCELVSLPPLELVQDSEESDNETANACDPDWDATSSSGSELDSPEASPQKWVLWQIKVSFGEPYYMEAHWDLGEGGGLPLIKFIL